MKTILVFVSTLDGKVTKWGNPKVKLWTSREDQDYYKNLLNESRLVVMGINTFNADTFKPAANRLILVMTGHQDKYKNVEVPGQIEFTKQSPVEIITRYSNKGFGQMMVVGGPHVATSFLKEQLIDEVWLTIEPKIFGIGGSFVTGEKLEINLRLLQCEKVNDHGTLITKYEVLKDQI